MRLVNKLIHWLIHSVIIAVLFVVIAFASVVISGIHPYVVLSGSMEPEIQTGSICFIDKDYEYEELQVGDVIAYTNGKISITHRIYELRENLIRTKGDANDSPDPYFISEQNYLGYCKGAIPYAGYAVVWLQSRKGQILTITFGIALMLLDSMVCQGDNREPMESQQGFIENKSSEDAGA